MLALKIDNKNYSFPISWDEVSLRQYMELRNCSNDYVKLLSIIIGAPYEVLFNARTLDIDEKIEPFIKFLQSPLNVEKLKTPNEIMIKGIVYQVPKDLGQHSFGQKITLQNRIAECVQLKKDPIECMPFAIAMYFQPMITGGHFKTEETEKLLDTILDLPIVKVYPIGSFFLMKYLVFASVNQKHYLLNRLRNKLGRILKPWIGLKNFVQYIRLRRATH